MRDGITAREPYECEKLTKISHGKIYRGKIKRNVMVVHANFRISGTSSESIKQNAKVKCSFEIS